MKRQKNFYDHLVKVESLTIQVNRLDLNPSQKKRVNGLIKSSVHYTLVNTLMSDVPEKERPRAIKTLNSGNYNELWSVFDTKKARVEGNLRKAFENLSREILRDLKDF